MAAKTRDIGPYRNAELLGRGGFGSVYRVNDPEHGREVAIKVLQGQLGETERRRFDRERQTMGRLGSHPNIVPVYDSGYTEGGEGYIVMELATGGSLRERIDREGGLGWKESAAIMAAIAKAAEAAHNEGVLHRDIKPDNILIDSYGNPKLTDFGIAAVASNATATTSMTATVAHAAPEILQGQTGNHSIDIYAIGSTFYNLVTGLPPFQRADDFGVPAMITRALTEDPPDLRQHGVPDQVARVIERSLAKEPGARQPTAAQLADELLAAVAEAEAGGGPTSPPVADAGATQIAPPIDLNNLGPGPGGGPPQYTPNPAGPPQYTPNPAGPPQYTPNPAGPPQYTPNPAGPPQYTPNPAGQPQYTGQPGGYQTTGGGGYQPHGLAGGGVPQPEKKGGGRGLLIGALAAVAVVVLGVGGFLLFGGGDDDDGTETATGSSETTASTTEDGTDGTTGDGTGDDGTGDDGDTTTSSDTTTTTSTTSTTTTTTTTTTTEPLEEGAFGAISLEAGFLPDPFSVSIVSGGSNDAQEINTACEGFIAGTPDYVVRWVGNSSELTFIFLADTVGEDSTLVIDAPDGLYCQDDSDGTVDPRISIGNPVEGTYRIWVGSFTAGDFLNGELFVTERPLVVGDLRP